MAQAPDISSLHAAVTSSLVSATRTVSELCAEDLVFHRQLDPQIGHDLDNQNARLLDLAEKLINNASADRAGGRSLRLREDASDEGEGTKEAIDAQWGKIVDVVDGLLERADASLDEYTGLVKRGKVQQTAEDEKAPIPTAARSPASKINVLRHQNIPKPQLQFEHPPQNDEKGPWRPLLTTKPHAQIPLERSLKVETSVDEDGKRYQHYQHPYASEIKAYSYPAAIRVPNQPTPSQDWSLTTATFVDTLDAVHVMLAELKQASEIAVDLEHHDFRTYVGLTSLMQISTRSKDYIVDTLKPWRQELQVLNEVFADPSIMKVLHGSTMDMIWLQRDLGIYVVGLFDTYHASRALRYQRAGLDFLLAKFVNFQAQKKYQRADWRIRPLPKELFDYARSDTHYLLYIYDCMRNELISGSTPEADLTEYVLENSRQEAFQRYEHVTYDPEGSGAVGWMKVLLNTSAMLNSEQFSVFRAVHVWRDAVAREEDESLQFVMPNHALFAVARAMPADKAALFGSLQGVSLPVRLRADELVRVVAEAKERGHDGPQLNEVLSANLGKRKRDQADHSVGGAVKRLQLATHSTAAQAQTGGKISPSAPRVEDIRATRSSFWGHAFNSIKATATAAGNAIRLALPLPPLTAQPFADATSTPPIASPQPRSAATSSTGLGLAGTDAATEPVESENTTLFVARKAGGRKGGRASTNTAAAAAAAASLDNGAAVDQEEAEDGDDGISRAAAATTSTSAGTSLESPNGNGKASKKARKRARRDRLAATPSAGDAASNGTPGDERSVADDHKGDADAPFDYAAAPSVLHAVPGAAAAAATGGAGRKKGGGGKQQQGAADAPFDVYKRALDAPKGLGKRQKGGREAGGKSMTFAR